VDGFPAGYQVTTKNEDFIFSNVPGRMALGFSS